MGASSSRVKTSSKPRMVRNSNSAPILCRSVSLLPQPLLLPPPPPPPPPSIQRSVNQLPSSNQDARNTSSNNNPAAAAASSNNTTNPPPAASDQRNTPLAQTLQDSRNTQQPHLLQSEIRNNNNPKEAAQKLHNTQQPHHQVQPASSNRIYPTTTGQDQRITQVTQISGNQLSPSSPDAHRLVQSPSPNMANPMVTEVDYILPPDYDYDDDDDDDDDECAICLEAYDEENPRTLSQCRHYYHLSCILEWMERSPKCPMCDKVFILDETNN